MTSAGSASRTQVKVTNSGQAPMALEATVKRMELDEYGNPTENVYILKVEKVNGKLQNAVIHTYPMVSQFWTYKPEDFLKAPAYDRNYPAVKP